MYHPSPPHQTYSTCFDVRASICRSHCIYRHICFPNNLNAFSGFNWTGDASRRRSPNLTGECSRVHLLATLFTTMSILHMSIHTCVDEKFNLEVVPSNSLTGECSRVPLLATSHLGWVTPPHANLSLPMINARKHIYTHTNTFIFFLNPSPHHARDQVINLFNNSQMVSE